MKKLFLIAASLVLIAPSFAQTKETLKTTTTVKTKVVKDKKVSATTKAGMPVKKSTTKSTTKTTQVLATPAMTVAPVEVIKPAIDNVEPNTAIRAQVDAQVAAPAPVLVDPNKDFEFKNDAFDFGKIAAGKPAKYELFIKNVSKETQELTLVQPGCGCTTPEYQQGQKIAPGESAKVSLGYNGGAPGNGSPFSKSVTVTLKGHAPKVVTFRGETYAVPTESAPANKATETLKPAGGK